MSVIIDKREMESLPALALRGVVAFPKMTLTLDVGRKKSINALKYAMEAQSPIYLVTQKNILIEEPNIKDLYGVGCICRVRQVLKMPDGVTKVLLEGIKRAKHINFVDKGKFYACAVEPFETLPLKSRPVYIESLLRRIREELFKYVQLANLPDDVAATAETNEDLEYLCDYLAYHVPAPFDDKQFILEQNNIVKRAKILISMLNKERQISEIDKKIIEKTRHSIDDNQREFYLKEQMRIISDELYGDDSLSDTESYFERVSKLNADESVKKKLRSEISKLSKMPQGSHDGAVVRNWLDTCLELPWGKLDKVSVDVNKAKRILDRDFYGMEKVKERILEMLSVYALSPDITGQILCLAGPPGVGKTSIGKTIAECMGRKFARVSLGGMHDEAEIRGHRKTYVGAMAGRIISAIKQCGTSNPLILLDEIDKLASDYKGDPSSALLEVLDPEQNKSFCDNYIEMPYDLSKVVFITTANVVDSIPPALLDRMELISLEGYTRQEKFSIAKKHLLPKELASHALNKNNCKISDGALLGLIDFYTREAGVRKLQRAVGSLCAKAAKKIASGECDKVIIKDTDLEVLLGKHKYRPEEILEQDEVGIINGLAWTAVGGEIMQLEVVVLSGTGKIELTGSLGDVMKESAAAAVTYVRANAAKYGINEDFYKLKDIHIHATEAAVPKDGPSAGVTITTALISALTGREVRRDVAMTGEVTIRGRVLAIGGLKEKSMAAYRGGVKTVFIPKDNIPDLEEVDKTVKENVRFIPVSYVDEIIQAALVSLEAEAPSEQLVSVITDTARKERISH